MTEQKSHRPETLEQRLGSLSLEIAPQLDLWPGIAARLAPRIAETVRQPSFRLARGWLPIGAALAAGYFAASLLPLPWGSDVRLPDADPAVTSVQLLTSVQPALSQLPLKTRAVVMADLSGLEQDRLSIEQALAVDPENPLLQDLRMSAQDRAAAVVERMNRLTRPEPPEDVEI